MQLSSGGRYWRVCRPQPRGQGGETLGHDAAPPSMATNVRRAHIGALSRFQRPFMRHLPNASLARMRLPFGLVPALSVALTVGCGGGDTEGKEPATPSDGSYESGSDGQLLDPPVPVSGDDLPGGLDAESPFGGFFRYGINGGYPNSAWSDPMLAEAEVNAGCNSQRLSLPERHLDQWGLGIELSDMEAYAELGMDGQVAFLSSPIRAHSSAPASAEDWELAYYIPKNLYEPILLDSGSINPENYWGKYVYDVVSTYKAHVKIWEIWNEPDYVSDWQLTQQWGERAPTAEDLPRFGGSIFEYVRMLRVSKIAAQLADPDAKIATGGIGYASFLEALLRYTDNPEGGAVSERYPYAGGAYVDVLSFHHYPIYSAGNSDAAVDAYLEHRVELGEKLREAGVEVEAWETTESGAPSVAIGQYPGGSAYARNYLMKLMVRAQSTGVDGIDWFMLSNSGSAATATDSYAMMGLYQDVSELELPADAVLTDTGVAYATLGELLGGARFDATATNALSLPDGVFAAAFETRDGIAAWAIWAVSDSTDEVASAEVALEGAWRAFEWDFSRSAASVLLLAGEPVALTASVRILIAQ